MIEFNRMEQKRKKREHSGLTLKNVDFLDTVGHPNRTVKYRIFFSCFGEGCALKI